jgi:putative ABC transport system substrate-binding protein
VGRSNISVKWYWNVAEPGRAQVGVKDVIALQAELIVSHSTPVTIAVAQLTKTILIVFVDVGDPVAIGLVTSFARPGGNITRFTNLEPSMGGKWVEVLKDIDPRIGRIAILFNPETAAAGGKYYLASFKAAGAANASPVPIAATIALEKIGPMPGTVISRSQPLS